MWPSNFRGIPTYQEYFISLLSAIWSNSNHQKFFLYFSRNVPHHIKNQIKGVFSVPTLQHNTMYLGHPLIFFAHKDKNRAYNFIHNKFIAKFGTLKANKNNNAGRL
jgi:hypothetical protein